MMQNNTRTFVAEASAIMSSDLYMTVAMVMFEAEVPNLNGVRVTEAFIDDIVTNQDKYITLPLVADTRMLWAGGPLGHKYDATTDTFDTTIIGSFYKFEKKVETEKASLVGYARISKRDQETCNAVSKLYAENKLKFSFEIACSVISELSDGTVRIDVDSGNYLTGLCLVSQPACPNAVAMQLVAEEEEENKMEVNEIISEEIVVEETTSSVQDTPTVNAEEAVASTEETIKDEVKPEEECAECKGPECEPEKEKEEELECAETEDAACKNENGEDEEEVDAACKKKKCGEEKENAAFNEEHSEEEEASCSKKKNAEVEDLVEKIEELRREIAELRALNDQHVTELAELKRAVSKEVITEINPFLGEDLTLPEKKFSLLDSVETVNTLL